MSISLALTPAVLDTIKPRPKVRTVDWAARHVSTPRGSEIKGKFRPDLFPHVAEILDCFDDDYYREITFQGASRLGKTVLAQVALAKVAATNPHPMAIADADEKSTKRVIDRTWLLFEPHAESELVRVREILDRHPGETDVMVFVDSVDPKSPQTRVRYQLSPPQRLRVSCSANLRRELEAVLGEENLSFVSGGVKKNGNGRS